MYAVPTRVSMVAVKVGSTSTPVPVCLGMVEPTVNVSTPTESLVQW